MDFLTSIGVLLLSGMALGAICKRLCLPSLVGMLLIGIILSANALNLLSPDLLVLSPDELKKNGRSAIMLCFVPALFEILGYIAFGTWLLGMSVKESAIMGCALAAVSPAVIVPRMLKLKEEGYGTDKGIPQMVMAGASADDIFVIVLFSSLMALPIDRGFDFTIIWKIPCSIVLGVGVGLIFGMLFSRFIKKIHLRDSIKVILMMCISILFISLQNYIERWVPFSGLLAIIAMSAMLCRECSLVSKRLSAKYSKLWLAFEIFLFVLVGAEVDVRFALAAGSRILLVMSLAMAFRLLGVYICVLKTELNRNERLFCLIAYIPKATVQAAIGAIPLSRGLSCGQTVLTAAVLSILITAPIGAFLIDSMHQRLLNKQS